MDNLVGKSIMIDRFICSSKEAGEAYAEAHEARDNLCDFWEEHPDVYIGISEIGRALVTLCIEKNHRLIEFVNERWQVELHEEIEFLESLFFDLPPRDPNDLKKIKERHPTLFFFP